MIEKWWGDGDPDGGVVGHGSYCLTSRPVPVLTERRGCSVCCCLHLAVRSMPLVHGEVGR